MHTTSVSTVRQQLHGQSDKGSIRAGSRRACVMGTVRAWGHKDMRARGPTTGRLVPNRAKGGCRARGEATLGAEVDWCATLCRVWHTRPCEHSPGTPKYIHDTRHSTPAYPHTPPVHPATLMRPHTPSPHPPVLQPSSVQCHPWRDQPRVTPAPNDSGNDEKPKRGR